MPSLAHELLVDLFRSAPRLAPVLLAQGLGVRLPPGEASLASEDLSAALPTTYRADAVVLLREEGRLGGAVIVEVQLREDPDKAWSWPSYVVNLHAALRCPVWLMVVAPDERVARWAARPWPVGHPGLVLTPLVVGPRDVPRVCRLDEARRLPELAVLSVRAHAHEPDEVLRPVAWAALLAAAGLDEARCRVYSDVVMAAVGDALRLELEAMVQHYEPQSPTFRRWWAEGRQEGRQEGRMEGRQEGLLDGLRRAVLAVANAKVHAVPGGLPERLGAETRPEALNGLLVALGGAADDEAALAALDGFLASPPPP